MSLTIDAILESADVHHASDVFLHEGELPRLKINEEIMVLGEEPVSLPQMLSLWQACGAMAESDMDKDSGLISHTNTRFRVNLHRSMGRLAAVLRRIKTEVPTLSQLGAPEALLTKWASRGFGLILVTGPTGTGKSTTLASLLQWMNANMSRHIVTIEDPVEYVFSNQQSLITQREVGRDTTSFASGLRSAMRQAPDAVFLGEIRDFESALTALQAAETGHLVFSTLHSERVADTMDRYFNLFSKDHLGFGANLLADHLIGIVCQKLVRTKAGGLHLLVEHVENGGAMRDWIRRRDTSHIQEHLNKGTDPTAKPFLRSTIEAWRAGLITEEVGIEASSNEAEFRRAMRGIA